MLYGLRSNYSCWIQDRTHFSTARFMSKPIILPVSTWNTYNILPTLTSLPKEVLLWARILLVALHMWCLPPSAVCRGMSATVTLIPGKLLVQSWLNYNRILLNINTNHLKLSQMVYSNEVHTFSTHVLRYFACLTGHDVHLLQIQNLLLNFITDISLNSQ
jgi:hypothetical protein